ncbi:MAG: tetratricopeptide repeat protein [Bacteroidetes bacterium]|nr:tetratricopeptide repeat protein [Bacteroidota bacterium]
MVKQNKIIWQLVTVSILKKLAWVVLLYAGAAFAQKENKYIRNGNDQYYEDNYKEAEVDYMKALEKNPESVKGQYNLGGALYKQENYEDASKLYGNVASRAQDDKNKADALFNLGNSYVKAQKYEEAINAYKDALRIDPEDMDTKYNLEYAKKMMQQQQQQQQNQDQNKDQDKKEDQQQDQQQQDQQDQQEKQDQQKQQQDQQQDQQNNPQQQQQQPQPQQISKQDAERMLEALKNDENKTLEKVKLQQMQKVQAKKVEKDW